MSFSLGSFLPLFRSTANSNSQLINHKIIDADPHSEERFTDIPTSEKTFNEKRRTLDSPTTSSDGSGWHHIEYEGIQGISARNQSSTGLERGNINRSRRSFDCTFHNQTSIERTDRERDEMRFSKSVNGFNEEPMPKFSSSNMWRPPIPAKRYSQYNEDAQRNESVHSAPQKSTLCFPGGSSRQTRNSSPDIAFPSSLDSNCSSSSYAIIQKIGNPYLDLCNEPVCAPDGRRSLKINQDLDHRCETENRPSIAGKGFTPLRGLFASEVTANGSVRAFVEGTAVRIQNKGSNTHPISNKTFADDSYDYADYDLQGSRAFGDPLQVGRNTSEGIMDKTPKAPEAQGFGIVPRRPFSPLGKGPITAASTPITGRLSGWSDSARTAPISTDQRSRSSTSESDVSSIPSSVPFDIQPPRSNTKLARRIGDTVSSMQRDKQDQVISRKNYDEDHVSEYFSLGGYKFEDGATLPLTSENFLHRPVMRDSTLNGYQSQNENGQVEYRVPTKTKDAEAVIREIDSMRSGADLEDELDGGFGQESILRSPRQQLDIPDHNQTKGFQSLGEDLSDEEFKAQMQQRSTSTDNAVTDPLSLPSLFQGIRSQSLPPSQRPSRQGSHLSSPILKPVNDFPNMIVVPSRGSSPRPCKTDVESSRFFAFDESNMQGQGSTYNASPSNLLLSDMWKTPRYEFEPEPLISKARHLPFALSATGAQVRSNAENYKEHDIANVERVIKMIESERIAKAKQEENQKGRKDELLKRKKAMTEGHRSNTDSSLTAKQGQASPRDKKTPVANITTSQGTSQGAYWGSKETVQGIMDKVAEPFDCSRVTSRVDVTSEDKRSSASMGEYSGDTQIADKLSQVDDVVKASVGSLDQAEGEVDTKIKSHVQDISLDVKVKTDENLPVTTKSPSMHTGLATIDSRTIRVTTTPRAQPEPPISNNLPSSVNDPVRLSTTPYVNPYVAISSPAAQNKKPVASGWGELRSRVTPTVETAFRTPHTRNHRRSFSGSYILQCNEHLKPYTDIITFNSAAKNTDAILEARLNEATVRATEATLLARIRSAKQGARPRRASVASPLTPDILGYPSPSFPDDYKPTIARPLRSILKQPKKTANDESITPSDQATSVVFDTLRQGGLSKGAGGLALPALKAAAEAQKASGVTPRVRRVSFDIPEPSLGPTYHVTTGHDQAGFLVGKSVPDNGGVVPALGINLQVPVPETRPLRPLVMPHPARLSSIPLPTSGSDPRSCKRITHELLEGIGKVHEGQMLKEVEIEKRRLALELETIRTEGKQRERGDVLRKLDRELSEIRARPATAGHDVNVEEVLQRRLEELHLRKLALISEISAGFNDSTAQAKLKGKGMDLSGTFLFSPSETSSDVFEFSERSDVTSRALADEADNLIQEIKEGLHSLEDIKARKAVIELKLKGLKK